MFPCDNKQAWETLGNIKGGNCKCSRCTANFSTINGEINNLFKFHHFNSLHKKSFKEVFDLFLRKDITEEEF